MHFSPCIWTVLIGRGHVSDFSKISACGFALPLELQPVILIFLSWSLLHHHHYHHHHNKYTIFPSRFIVLVLQKSGAVNSFCCLLFFLLSIISSAPMAYWPQPVIFTALRLSAVCLVLGSLSIFSFSNPLYLSLGVQSRGVFVFLESLSLVPDLTRVQAPVLSSEACGQLPSLGFFLFLSKIVYIY